MTTPARERYERSLRRPRMIYAAALAVVVVVFGTVFTVVWATGSAAHATLRTVSAPPADLSVSPPSATQARAWSTTDRAVDGTPQYQGTVVTYSAKTLRGRNARTGAVTWSYTRTDRTICYAALVKDIALAVFRRKGDCDEVDAFAAGTGARVWQRTLDQNGQPVDGTPQFQIDATSLLVTTDRVVYAIDPVGDAITHVNAGIDRWTYTRYGCHIDRAVLGDNGVLISQTCSSLVRCTGLQFCGTGKQLLLRDPTTNTGDDKSKPNYDQITWNRIGYQGVPVSAEDPVLTVQPNSNVLEELDAAKGTTTDRVELDPAPTSLGGIVATDTDSGELVWLDGHSYLIGDGATKPAWVATTTGPPTVIGDASVNPPQLADARITAPTTGGVAVLDPDTGRVSTTYRVSIPSGATVYPLGTGFLVAGAHGLTAYR